MKYLNLSVQRTAPIGTAEAAGTAEASYHGSQHQYWLRRGLGYGGANGGTSMEDHHRYKHVMYLCGGRGTRGPGCTSGEGGYVNELWELRCQRAVGRECDIASPVPKDSPHTVILTT